MKNTLKIFMSFTLVFVLFVSLGFVGCKKKTTTNKENDDNSSQDVQNLDVETEEVGTIDYGFESQTYENGTLTINFLVEDEEKTFVVSGIKSQTDVAYVEEDSVLTISSWGNGSLTFSGDFYGQVVFDFADADTDENANEFGLDFDGVSIICYTACPLYIKNALTTAGDDIDKFEISAKKNTENYVGDGRAAAAADEDIGSAIYATCDLKFKGAGELKVISNKNNGIHSKDDLKLQKLTLTVNCVDNCLKGNDSVEIESGTYTLVAVGGDGIKTSNSSLSSKGSQKGSISIAGGTIGIYAACDGIDAAFDANISGGTINIYTYTYATSAVNASAKATENFPQAVAVGGPQRPGGGDWMQPGNPGSGPAEDGNTNKLDYSTKGIKADNSITISGGTIFVKSYDDAIHTNTDVALESGVSPTGALTISGGTLDLYSMDDAVHADGTLTISGGTTTITNSYEGLEGNVINITDGTVVISASDDGINGKSAINISGGFVDVTVPVNSDSDGIDSNGTYTQTGGIVIARGSNNTNMAALDTNGTAQITGGTIIILGALGERGLAKGSGVSLYSLSLHSAGSHSVTIDGAVYSFTNNSTYGRTLCYSSVSVSA